MKLNVFERLSILQILPQEGNFMSLKIVRDLQDKIALNEDDYKKFGVKEEGNSVMWNSKGNEPQEIEIGEKSMEIIVKAFKDMESQNKLNIRLLSLYERFVKPE